MRTSKNIPLSLVIFLGLSGILHAAAVFSVSATGVSGLAELFSEKMFYASLVQERPEKFSARRPAGKYSGVYSPHAVYGEDGPANGGIDEGGAEVQGKV